MAVQKTTIDYLTLRTQADPAAICEAFKPLFGHRGSALFLKDSKPGKLGFSSSVGLFMGDMKVGRLDFGGDFQRGWCRVEVPGKPLEWVQDWDSIDSLEALDSCEIRRLDLALTTWRGEITHEMVVKAHSQGRFVTGGRPPDLRTIVSSNRDSGRTCYVGKREKADKFFRSYEKGLEMMSDVRLPGGVDMSCIEIDGAFVRDIYRCEIELKAPNRPIGFEVIERRDQFFSGCYPFCADILPNVESDILMRRKERVPQRELSTALRNLRTQWGNTLFTALAAHHGDVGAVWDLVIGSDHNKDLLEAGVLLVDH